jgi:hypothetical protein
MRGRCFVPAPLGRGSTRASTGWSKKRPPKVSSRKVFSIQDIALVCMLDYVDARGEYLQGLLEWRGRPRIEAIVGRCRDRPSMQATFPGPASQG